MALIKVRPAGEHIVVDPGRFEITNRTPFQFWNLTDGEVRIMFLQDGLLQLNTGERWVSVKKDKFLGCEKTTKRSKELRLANDPNATNAGEYDYVVVFESGALSTDAKKRRGEAKFGVALGGSSPRIIVKPPPAGGSGA